MAYCFSCGGALDEIGRVYRNTLCPHCGADVKVCLNCRFYDPSAHWECRETIPEAVREKDRANFCDYFVLREDGSGAPRGRTKEGEKKQEARNSFDSLFGGGDSSGDV
jgi:predicted RNA-binding Zn-ribbon protein involved in translation (DUF1610 family)